MTSKPQPRPSKKDLQDKIKTWENRAEIARQAALEQPERREEFEDLVRMALRRKEECEAALSELEE
jgi:phage shock protein A